MTTKKTLLKDIEKWKNKLSLRESIEEKKKQIDATKDLEEYVQRCLNK